MAMIQRVKRKYGIFWPKKKNYPWYMVHFIFFRNRTFLFVKIESLNFQHLFDLGFCEILQTFSSFRQTFRWHFLWEVKVTWMSWNFVRFHENYKSNRFQISILTQRKVLFLKRILSAPYTDYSFWDRLCNFLHKFTWIVL